MGVAPKITIAFSAPRLRAAGISLRGLIVLNIDASRLMSSLVLFKAFACLVVIFWSLWISLAKRSHSSFAVVVFSVQVRNCFLFPVMPMRVVSGRPEPMRVGLRTGILRLRVLMDGILFEGEENILIMRETTSANSDISFEAYFGLQPFVNLKHNPNL
jgi:hypothetical protein